jgi:predicted nucleic acid-binding protein
VPTGWIIDNSVAGRAGQESVQRVLLDLAPHLYVCPMARLERLYSAQSGSDYDALAAELTHDFFNVDAPPDIFDRVLELQRDLAHHHGLWHRISIADLFIAETALHHDLGVVHVDADYERVAEVRSLRTCRIEISRS